MKIFNDNNLAGNIKPIAIWIIILIICTITTCVIMQCKLVLYEKVINEIFNYGMIDKFQRMSLISKWIN